MKSATKYQLKKYLTLHNIDKGTLLGPPNL